MAKPRRGRSADTYSRPGPVRQPYDHVLIVCEGRKTEPNYLQGLKSAYRLSSANIKVVHPSATDPMSIVRFAEAELRDGDYDRVYCLFDRDTHSSYTTAIQRVSNLPAARAGQLSAVTSVPCFEVWLLLHFTC